MPQIEMTMAADDTGEAVQWLDRTVEQLEVAGKRIKKIRYPALYAERLGIAGTIFRGHAASPTHGGPYVIVIEHD